MSVSKKKNGTHSHHQESLAQHEPFFRALIEHSSDIIVLANAEGTVTYVSPSIIPMTGYPPEAFLGHPALERVHPDDRDHMQHLFSDFLQSPGKSVRTAYRLHCQDGSWRWFEGVGTNLLDDAQVGAIVGNFRDITERKQAEDALQAEERRFHMAWEFASDAMTLSDEEGTVLAANPAYYQLYGFKPADVIGNPFSIIFPQEQQAWAQAQYNTIFASEKGNEAVESSILRADGTVRIVEATYDFLVQHGRRTAMISIIRDITERKQAQEQLKANEERFRALLEHSTDAISLLDKDGRRLYASPASARIVGYEPTEFVGVETFGHIHPADVQHLQNVFATMMRQPGKSFPAHFRVRHKNRDWVWLEGTGTNLLDHPSVQAVVVNYRDITQRKHLEEALRQSREQLEVILQNIADGICVQDSRGSIVYMNEAGATLCGYGSPSEVMRTPDFQTQRASILQRFELRDAQGKPVAPAELPGSRALCGEQAPQAIVQSYDRVSQTQLWSLVKAQPIFGAEGQGQLAVTIFSDITRAYEAEQRKDEFIAMASHELKTPITTLKGLTQLVNMRLEKQGATEYLSVMATIENQLNRLTRLVNELLDVSKIQAGRLDYAEEPIAIDELLREIVELAQYMSPTHTITLQGASQSHILGDRDRLEQVFLNLIGNAIKYSPQAATVALRMSTVHETVIISVQDQGVGIPRQHQGKIFERFYRVFDGTTKTFPGLGMGLYISAEIVKRHGGTITVASEEGRGSTFTVCLPLKK
jgi:PAS domain S-box-containing protein